jgi:hypothetical protein
MSLDRTFLLASLTFAVLALAALSGCVEGVNGPVNVPPGATVEKATTVNGSVNVGDGAKLGEAVTVNGGVHIGDDVTAESAKTVNGGIRIGKNTKISQDVITVNGRIQLAEGADVAGKVSNVNGGIRMDAAHVGGGITTFNGDVEVLGGSRVEGGIHVDRPEISSKNDVPRIVIGPGSVVEGTLKFEREVKLYVSESAKIGTVEGATPQIFSGDSPEGSTSSSAGSDAPAAGASAAGGEPAAAGGREK